MGPCTENQKCIIADGDQDATDEDLKKQIVKGVDAVVNDYACEALVYANGYHIIMTQWDEDFNPKSSLEQVFDVFFETVDFTVNQIAANKTNVRAMRGALNKKTKGMRIRAKRTTGGR
jgi:hypothetical protein